jgi:hypothetical protein
VNSNELVAFCTFICMIGWVTWVVFSSLRRYKVARVQADVQKAFLSRFDSVQDLLTYVETEAGKKFLNSLTQESGTPYGHIMECVRWGIVLVVFGGTLLVLRTLGIVDQDRLIFGIVAVVLGVGFEVAAAVSYFLYRALGLLEPNFRH